MDARTSQGSDTPELPRNLYFGAEDVVAQQPSITKVDLAFVRGQRHTLVGNVAHKAEKLLSGVRALKDFDATGNAGSTLDHLEALRDDLGKLATNLIQDIERAEERYELATRVVIDEAGAPTVAELADEYVAEMYIAANPAVGDGVNPAKVAAMISRAAK